MGDRPGHPTRRRRPDAPPPPRRARRFRPRRPARRLPRRGPRRPPRWARARPTRMDHPDQRRRREATEQTSAPAPLPGIDPRARPGPARTSPPAPGSSRSTQRETPGAPRRGRSRRAARAPPAPPRPPPPATARPRWAERPRRATAEPDAPTRTRPTPRGSARLYPPADRIQAIARWLRDADTATAPRRPGRTSGRPASGAGGPAPGPARCRGVPGPDRHDRADRGQDARPGARPGRREPGGPGRRVPSLEDYLASRTRARERPG